jgi:hypothetical protein
MPKQGSWEDVKSTDKFDRLEIAVGTNLVRILEPSPYYFHEHWIELTAGPRKLYCSGENCLICKEGILAAKRYYIPVWDYKSKSVKILEGGSQIFNGLKNYHMDPDYGNVTGYDIKIVREGTGIDTKYNIMPSPPKETTRELTPEMKESLEALGDLSEYAKETPLEEQQSFVAQMKGKVPSHTAATKAQNESVADDFFKTP